MSERDSLVRVREPEIPPPVEVILGVDGLPCIHMSRRDDGYLLVKMMRGKEWIEGLSLTAPERRRLFDGLHRLFPEMFDPSIHGGS